ncbi:hypothetical protein FB451DRAFT_1407135 [Mycena latifolia]|nr:hypothetical protein FB451DRAFT_1407135 [Mycena latifolia]
MANAQKDLGDPQSKAFKKEALRKDGKVTSPRLKIWLDRQRFPPKPAGPPKKSYYEQLRARLVARKARVTALMELRARALENSRRRWSRPYHLTAAATTKGAKATGGGKLAAKEILRAKAEAEAARETRIAHLMALRTGARK